ncbi:MAG: hypothetical protein JJE50_06040 [Actinomycetales bacterium]|nr:hypothetical protein [Actinomycetales bacterium]
MSIEVPTSDDVDALAARMRARGVELRRDGATLRFDDPWKTVIEVRPALVG